MIRLLTLTVSMIFVSVSAAHALVVSFDPRISIRNSQVSFDNLSIVRDIRTFESGTGTASASANTRLFSGGAVTEAFLEVEVGPGAGSAAASISIVSTFDILFPQAGDFPFLVQIDVSAVPGRDLQSGEFALAERITSVIVGSDTLNQLALTSTESYRCPGILCSESFKADGDFIAVGDTFLSPGRDLRLPVTMLINFSLSALAIPEPSPFPLVVLALAWLMISRLSRASPLPTSMT